MPENRLSLWMFDFDGTLSPLVADRTAAKLDPNCRRMLIRLAAVEGFYCAIISSRHLPDLAKRVDTPGIYLAGSSGLEWQLPEGRRKVLEDERLQKIRNARRTLLPELMGLSRLLGVEMEDKYWSVALHTRRACQQAKKDLSSLVARRRKAWNVAVLKGPEVIEVQLLPGIDKSVGVRAFCELVGYRSGLDRLVYAGDDENDALAMQVVSGLGGRVVTVGEKALVPNAAMVRSPGELARTICRLADIRPAAVRVQRSGR